MTDPTDLEPAFYKIIHTRLGTTQNLRIPTDFVKQISQHESGSAILEGPSGNHWMVKFQKTVQGTYIEDGWQDFVKDHSLENYEFLVFRYNGNMHFHVQIFDMTACENEDAFNIEPHQEPAISQAKKHGSASKELVQPSRRGRGRPRKGETPKIRGRLPSKSLPSEKEKERVKNMALSFASSLLRPYFLKTMSYSTVYKSFVVAIPEKFARNHFPKVSTKVELKNQIGKTKTVNIIRGKTSKFCGGWPDFAYDNKLEAGDVCVFELVAKLQMCVHIFRCQTT